MKEKIEEILEAYTNYGFGENLDNVIEMDFKMKTPTGKVGEYIGYPSLVNELTTLIQQEREEAIRGFVDNIGWKKPSEVIDLADDVIDGRSLVKQMEAYLQSDERKLK